MASNISSKYFQLQEKLWTDEDVVSREQSQTTWSCWYQGMCEHYVNDILQFRWSFVLTVLWIIFFFFFTLQDGIYMPFCCVMRGNRFRIQYLHTKSVHHSLNFVFYQYNLFLFALLKIIKKSSARSESSQFIIFFPSFF